MLRLWPLWKAASPSVCAVVRWGQCMWLLFWGWLELYFRVDGNPSPVTLFLQVGLPPGFTCAWPGAYSSSDRKCWLWATFSVLVKLCILFCVSLLVSHSGGKGMQMHCCCFFSSYPVTFSCFVFVFKLTFKVSAAENTWKVLNCDALKHQIIVACLAHWSLIQPGTILLTPLGPFLCALCFPHTLSQSRINKSQ